MSKQVSLGRLSYLNYYTPPCSVYCASSMHKRKRSNFVLLIEQTVTNETLDVINAAEKLVPSWIAKLIFLAVVIILAIAASHLSSKAIRKFWSLDAVNMPSSSIFINLMRILIWGLAFCLILEPLFGVKPTAVLTALGVGGLALSFGMKDTIANIVAGIQLTLGKIIAPGDHVKINGITGTVHDISWRHTTVVSRIGELISIPNSVLNTSALIKLTSALEGFTTITFIVSKDYDPDIISKELVTASYEAASEQLLPFEVCPSEVKFLAFEPYGIKGELWLYVKPGNSHSFVKDKVCRLIRTKPYFVQIPQNLLLEQIHAK